MFLKILTVLLLASTPLQAVSLFDWVFPKKEAPCEHAKGMKAVLHIKHPRGGYGSGFFISSKGYLITNYHVAKPFVDSKINLIVDTYDGKTFWAEVLELDEENDLALARVLSERKDFPYLRLDEDGRKVGIDYYLLGNGGGDFWKAKVISYLGVDSRPKWELRFQQGIKPGDSGGPIIDLEGEVVGVGSARSRKSGYTYAVPVNDIKRLVEQHNERIRSS